ncbi:MAG: hypothetical protein M0P39_14420 [Rhodocyclaceae bacterium]|nr:hypothetical protein [Rhodocyclaceae bacterium]
MWKTNLATLGLSLVLGGCAASPYQLSKDSSPELLRGEFLRGQQNRLVLESAEQKYVAEGFEVHRDTNLAELRKRYRNSNPKHWDRIFAGFDKTHEVYSAELVPKAQDGSELSCRLTWASGSAPQGICLDKAGKEYQVRFD